MSIKLTIVATGPGTCALTGKQESDGLSVAFENETPCFVSWKAFKQLLAFRLAQNGKPVTPAAPVNAIPARPS